jgi:predicted ribosome-associated RNA-binding protein Tma20
MKHDLRNKKHRKIITDYDKIKSKHLEKLADEMLKNDDKNEKLKKLKVDIKFLDLF